jgi:KDO2-lipid IV(A) lauroyltransferase
MTLDLQRVLNSSLSLRLAYSMAQSLPPRLGYRIAYGLADHVARRRDSDLVRAVRANQWVAGGETASAGALDRAVRETLRYSARSLFDLYHYIRDFEATRQRIVFDSSFESILGRREFEDRGLMVAGLHLSSFDLILQWLCKGGMKLMVITIPNPQGGRQIEYEIRRQTGMSLIPASVSAFRRALKHLQHGGMVLTGIDRPIEEPEIQPHFFGRPAALPMHHIFLAMKARVPIVITVSYLQADGRYHVFASEPIEMDFCSREDEARLHNAEKVLAVAETFILRSPRQWSVPLPVWPQVVDRVPS